MKVPEGFWTAAKIGGITWLIAMPINTALKHGIIQGVLHAGFELLLFAVAYIAITEMQRKEDRKKKTRSLEERVSDLEEKVNKLEKKLGEKSNER